MLWCVSAYFTRCTTFDLVSKPEADKYRSSTRNSIGGPLPSPLDIALHPLYFYLHFTPSPTSSGGGTPEAEVEDPLLQPDYMSILLTHLPTFPESKRSQYGPLCSHPNASCAFATFPPMQSLSFQDPWGRVYITVENPDGITILDVNRAFAQLYVTVQQNTYKNIKLKSQQDS